MKNNNKAMLDRPMWEQLTFHPALPQNIGGTNMVDDGERYIYQWIQTSGYTAQFWRYDTFTDSYQQLSTPPVIIGGLSNLTFTKSVGGQLNGQVHGSIYLFIGNSSTCCFYKYDIATATWSANLGTTNVPATFTGDCYLAYPGVSRNNFETNYHTGVTRTISLSASASAGATTLSVTATAEQMAMGTALRFGIYKITVSATAVKGATSLTVTGATMDMSAGTILKTSDGYDICLSSASLAGDTTLSIKPLRKEILAGNTIVVEQWAVLTAFATAGATTLTISPLRIGIDSVATPTAGYYGNMYLIGNNAAVMYRYNIGANNWNTTSANSGNPAIPSIIGATGVGCALKWLPGYEPDKLYAIRGGATTQIYVYNLVLNTWSTLTYYPSSETFGIGTMVAARDINGKQSTLFIQKDVTMRIYELVPYKNTLEPVLSQWLYPSGPALVGDKSLILTSPDGIDFYYILLPSTNAFLRCALIDS